MRILNGFGLVFYSSLELVLYVVQLFRIFNLHMAFVLQIICDVLFVICRVSRKKKTGIEAAERKLKQVHERLETRRQELHECESKMVYTY